MGPEGLPANGPFAEAPTMERPVTAPADAEVVRRVLDGETALFELLMRRHDQRVYRAVRSILRDEAEAYAKKMEAAGVPVKLMRCNGMTHGFLNMVGLLKRATAYFDEIAAEIRKMAAA